MKHQPDTGLALPYQLILEAAGFAFFVTDHEGHIEDASTTVANITGYTHAELKGQNLRLLIDEGPYQEFLDSFSSDEVPDVVHHLKLPITTKTGDTVWVEAHFVAYAQDEHIHYYSIIREITAQIETEAALKSEHHRFRGLFERSNDAVFFIDLNGIIIDVNQAGVDMLGTTPDDQIGRRASDNTIEREYDAAKKIRERLMLGEDISIYERTFRRADGSTFPAEINVALVRDANGNPSHIQSIVRDISQRKQIAGQLEEQLWQITTLRDIDAELTERLNPDYVLMMALDSAMRLSGSESGFIGLLNHKGKLEAAKVIGDYPPILDQLDLNAGIIGRVIRNLKAEWVPDVHRDPDYLDIRESTRCKIVVPLVTQESVFGVLNLESAHPDQFNEERFELVKQVASRIAIAFDNARLYRQSETQLQELQTLYNQIKSLEQLKTDMIRMASHDLRNPLGGILGFIDLIKTDPQLAYESGSLIDYLDNIQDAAKQMKRIAEDILTLERLENATEEAINVTEMVELIFQQHVARSDLHKHTLTFQNAADEPPIFMMGDANQIHEAIDNLISNAIKYTPSQGRIEVSLFREGAEAVLKVRDNGIGVKKENHDKLFKPFSRIKSRETAMIDGTGLGLHLVKQIIERHGGQMFFESEFGEGSTFGFRIMWIMQ